LKGAAKLGFPVVRLQYFASVAAERLIPYAEKLNLKMGYELHAPLMIEAPLTQELLEQINRLGSDRLNDEFRTFLKTKGWRQLDCRQNRLLGFARSCTAGSEGPVFR